MQNKRSSGAPEKRSRKSPSTLALQSDPLFAAVELSAKEYIQSPAASRGSTAALSPGAGSSTRRKTALPLCMSRSQQEAAVTAYASPPAFSSSRRRSTLLVVPATMGLASVGNDELPENVERALQMLTTYPLMRVTGTAFENSLRTTYHQNHTSMRLSRCSLVTSPSLPTLPLVVHPDKGDNDESPTSAASSVNGSTMLESSAVIQSVLDDSAVLNGGAVNGNETGRDAACLTVADRSQAAAIAAARTRPDNMVRLAAAIKRASMWQTIAVNALGHTAMTEQFRVLRLRRALEQHMLPTLLRRREETGSIIDQEAVQRVAAKRRRASALNRRSTGGADTAAGALPSKVTDGETPTSSYLREHSPFLASLGNLTLLDSLAETMARYRFHSGEVIASAQEPSQTAMYFLVSGKCEVRGKLQPGQGGPAAAAAADTVSCPAKHSSTVVGGGGGGDAGGADRNGSVQVLYSGDTFGGIFNSSATFLGTYKAISQCILWVLRADDFERVFKAFADHTMIEQYVAALRAHGEECFPVQYPIQAVLPRVPIYRVLSQPVEKYMNDFTPVVKVRGEKLFDQGDAAGDIYCLVEGRVRRSLKGVDGSYASGIAQDLTLNSFSTVKVAGRCVLLGEEPHLVPCTQRYRCIVSSRTAMLFKIPGQRFVSALLDDPTQYVELRERLSKLFASQMKLDPTCLAFAPLLRPFPATSLQTLAQAAEPRVFGRSLAMSEPAQGLREIFLVVSGEVRDSRVYGHHPTKPLPTPPSSDNDEDAEENAQTATTAAAVGSGQPAHGRLGKATAGSQGAKGKEGKPGGKAKGLSSQQAHRGGGQGKSRTADAAPTSSKLDSAEAVTEDDNDEHCLTASFFSEKAYDETTGAPSLDGTLSNMAGSGGNRVAAMLNSTGGGSRGDNGKSNINNSSVDKRSRHAQPQQLPHHPLASTFSGTRGVLGGGAPGRAADRLPLVTPDEQQEFNPPMPPLPAKRFLYTLGGGWEGLLLDKWPNGWGTTSLVEAWSIPTAKIRGEFNCCPKSVQATILLAAREQQRLELGLPSLSTAKLPPMSVYHQSNAAAVTAAALEKATNASSAAATESKHGATSVKDRRTGAAAKRHSVKKNSTFVGAGEGVGGADAGELLSMSGSACTLQPTPNHPQAGVHGSFDSGCLATGSGERPSTGQMLLGPPASFNHDGARQTGGAVASALKGGTKVDQASASATAATGKRVTYTASLPAPAATGAPPVTAAGSRTGRLTKGKRSVRPTALGAGKPNAQDVGGGYDEFGNPVPADTEGTTAPPSNNLLALYNGEFRDDEMLLYSNIVREPTPPSSMKKTKRSALPTTSSHTDTVLPAAAWPRMGLAGTGLSGQVSSSTATQWFREVPVCEPLPGASIAKTIKGASASTAAAALATAPRGTGVADSVGGTALPAFAINTMLLTRTEPGHADALQAQADYFSATNAARLQAAAGELSRRPKSDEIKAKAAVPSSARLDIPKRHVITM